MTNYDRFLKGLQSKPPAKGTSMGSLTYGPQPSKPTTASPNPYYPGASNFSGSRYSPTADGSGSVGKPFHGGHDTPGGASNRPGYGYDDPARKAETDAFAAGTMANTELGRHLGIFPNVPDRYKQPTSPRGPSGGSYRGGAPAIDPAAVATANSLRQLLGSNTWDGRDISAELGDINKGVSADQASAASAYGRLRGAITGQGNAFRDMKLTQPSRLEPELAALLASQGGDAAAYRAELGLADTLAREGLTADERFRKAQAANIETRRDADLLASDQAGEYARSELEASGSAMSAALRERKRLEDKALQDQKMQVIMQMIQASAAAGQEFDPSKFLGV